MFDHSIKFFIENKIIAVLLLVVIVGLGIRYAPFDWNTGVFPRDPVAVDAIPDIGENQQIVFTEWPGHSPQDIEDQVTYPLTTALLSIPGVRTVRSSSMFGFSSIYIIFEDDVSFYWSRSRILEKLNALPKQLLPEGIQPNLGPDATALGQIFWYTLEGRDAKGNPTRGWDLHELRTQQDFFVKNVLASAPGVAEVASIGGHVQEYQIDLNPERMRNYQITLMDVVKAIRESNEDMGAKTLEINQVEYIVRGLGYIKSIADIENAVVKVMKNAPIKIKDIAYVQLGPAERRGILDKEGAEVAGGVVIARYGANPMEVIQNVKAKIAELSPGLPAKLLSDGRISKLTVVPFYDRTELIQDTLATLNEALTFEILITILVLVVLVYNLRATVLISGLLPLAVLMVFIAMKWVQVDANIVALSGIAIAIGTIVDVGVILCENIIRHKEEDSENTPANLLVFRATREVSGAILTAVLTTIVSFIPVFTLLGAEGKLFRPLAFTKTFALLAALFASLLLIPPFAALLFKKRKTKKRFRFTGLFLLLLLGVVALFFQVWIGALLLVLSGLSFLKEQKWLSRQGHQKWSVGILATTATVALANYWKPLGLTSGFFQNVLFVGSLCMGLLGLFILFRRYYTRILNWALEYKALFISLPLALVLFGFISFKQMGKEFLPALDEGSFLLMPTSMPHSGIEENKRVLQQLDRAVAAIPEVETVVGKAGRTASALDPAPLSMYENLIQYKSEFLENTQGEPQRFKVNTDGLYVMQDGRLLYNPNTKIPQNAFAKAAQIRFHTVTANQLIPDPNGAYFRNWRPHIDTPDAIWNEIVQITRLPGVTTAPKLQPIETRLVMLQTGMRAPMGIKIKGQDLKSIEDFGSALEPVLKTVEGVKTEAVFADRIIGKPYLLIHIDRNKIARYGLSIGKVQEQIGIAVGGKALTQTVEGRQRFAVRVRYPRELRSDPQAIADIYIHAPNGETLPLGELATIAYEQGPQVIKSEDTFLVGYVLFDKQDGFAEISVVENAKSVIQDKINKRLLQVPEGISFQFTGNYENQVRAEKTLTWVIPLALLIIWVILFLQFRSLATTMMVFSGIAVAFAGGFLMLWLYGQDWFLNFSLFGNEVRTLFHIKSINLSVAVWVGFIALFGIATDDGVVMATYLTQTFKRNKPKTQEAIRSSVIEAGAKRIRPCLMTTATTLLALLPILTATGKGSDIMIPMAIPAFGGMLVALITLFVVPVLYSWNAEIQLKKTAHEGL